jgi:hypothetical protein
MLTTGNQSGLGNSPDNHADCGVDPFQEGYLLSGPKLTYVLEEKDDGLSGQMSLFAATEWDPPPCWEVCSTSHPPSPSSAGDHRPEGCQPLSSLGIARLVNEPGRSPHSAHLRTHPSQMSSNCCHSDTATLFRKVTLRHSGSSRPPRDTAGGV